MDEASNEKQFSSNGKGPSIDSDEFESARDEAQKLQSSEEKVVSHGSKEKEEQKFPKERMKQFSKSGQQVRMPHHNFKNSKSFIPSSLGVNHGNHVLTENFQILKAINMNKM